MTTPTPRPIGKPTLQNVQALRGVACLLVVLFHLSEWDARFGHATYGLHWFQSFGFAGVDLFFVLSGFLITSTNWSKLGRPSAVPDYLFRRIRRIYPTYWAAMFISVLLLWFNSYPIMDTTTAAQWWHWLSLLPPGEGNLVIGPAWTLIYEVMFYLIFGLVMLLPRSWAVTGLACWAAAVVLEQGRSDFDLLPWSPLSPFILEFLAGCLVAGLIRRGITGGRRLALVSALVWAGTTAFLVPRLFDTMSYSLAVTDPQLRVFIWGLPSVLLLYFAVASELKSPRRLPRLLLLIGDASYSIYLLHGQLLISSVLVGLRFSHTTLPHLVWLLLTFLFIMGLGLAFHLLIEKRLVTPTIPRIRSTFLQRRISARPHSRPHSHPHPQSVVP